MTENNKLIAVFMGMKPLNNDSSVLVFSTDRGNDIISIDNLQYQDDWNLLMQVVEKIENFGFEFFIVESRCRIANNTDKSIETIIDFEIIGTKIQATYKAVVEFIKLYNQNK
ncbi:hypothetical protein elemo19C_phanotate35 [Flavobacterium phage vB_FspP_elemoA_1-9C]|jgi:hypothetical protein|uniref:Uncharacterized protein n=6 Tax=Elemovirus TaxID=2948694 RepID=A0A7D7F112_9CAUD|nr:hypothetical protein KNV10_gp77 [Flavobacterium phage vB_FspP_elemoA_7-9A]YP_010108939.1 hypothetical protein KNV11_gp74 [Flavobacterium phage vB_FspP_elemoF_6-3D]YP_010109027.1 hypothetical protein KNV12_gp74 [Flavobacterium phage vB_FspP_elemoE_6-9C]YP_010109125.1 hypothetical protein KNV13_gp42 [Flavobacterium phage vB_FspP_elemoD_13-5B]YP_010356110.1 hypothetical protein M1M19_gp79 [Flavobacterium phage vB_FspP_elemoB_14-3B]YP_010356472.1 hypothetical protein M1M21_gp76 [Flavobacterium 